MKTTDANEKLQTFLNDIKGHEWMYDWGGRFCGFEALDTLEVDIQPEIEKLSEETGLSVEEITEAVKSIKPEIEDYLNKLIEEGDGWYDHLIDEKKMREKEKDRK
jgi:hypothetical protein